MRFTKKKHQERNLKFGRNTDLKACLHILEMSCAFGGFDFDSIFLVFIIPLQKSTPRKDIVTRKGKEHSSSQCPTSRFIR
jgi:hypothetical protein